MSAGAINWDTPLEKVAIFRALNLGDMLCAIPALRVLRRRLPRAHISLIGLPGALPVMQQFPGFFDEFIAFPGDRAFPEQPVHESDLADFYHTMRRRHFDLVLQMHGSGRRANTLVRALAPVQWAGFVPESQQAEPGRLMPWPDHLHEVHRYLALLRYIGLEAGDDTLEFPVSAADRSRADSLAARLELQLEKTVFIHPGARLASRRWPIERFAKVARMLAEDGWHIAVTGSPGEADMARMLIARSGHALHDLCGATTLGVLASLLQRGKLLICNDTGVSHLAASVRLPSVVIASGSDVARWAPLDTGRHTVLHQSMACRPCAYNSCPIGHPCALAIGVERVLREAQRHLQEGERE
jgi:ADP-heptose:LPS heptosyltransferase